MKTRTRYKGYIAIGNCKEFYVKTKKGFKFMVDSSHLYVDEIKEDVFDSNGEFHSTITKENTYSKKEVKEVKKRDFTTVRQLNYNFEVFPYIGKEITQEEIQRVGKILNNSDLGNFNADYYEQLNQFTSKHQKQTREKYVKTPTEIVTSGCSYSLFKTSFKSFLDLDFIEYRNRKNDFITHNPDHKNVTEYLFNLNIQRISDYYMCKPEQLFKKSFNRSAQMIKRLNFKINQINN